VQNLAIQYDSITSNSSVKKSNQISQKEVMADLSNIESIQMPPILQSKPPIPKPQSFGDKLYLKSESQDYYDKLSSNIHNFSDVSKMQSINSSNSKLNPIVSDKINVESKESVTESIEHTLDVNKYYMKEKSSEFESKSDRVVVPFGTVVKTKQIIEENNLKRTNSYDSILTDLSLSLFDKRNFDSIIESKLLERSQSIKSKTHKRSTSLYSGTTKWIPLPALTTGLPPIRLCSSLSDQNKANVIKTNLNLVHSKSMPSVVEAVNEVLSSTQVIMNSLIESIPVSKTKSFTETSVSLESNDNNKQLELSTISTNPLVKSASVEDKSLMNYKKQDFETLSNLRKINICRRLPNDIFKRSAEKDSLVRRLTKELEAKAMGNSSDKKVIDSEPQLSQSTPSSPNFNRNARPRSSTLNDDIKNAQNTPFVPHLPKTNFEHPFKRSKSQSSFDNKFQSNKISNISNNMEMSSTSSTKVSKTSKKCSLPQIQTNVNTIRIQSSLSLKSGTESQKKQPQKKLQQGKSHPLTRLMPQNSKFKNSGPLLNTM
jgi:hypothetical protein